jgi:hypothetical protein
VTFGEALAQEDPVGRNEEAADTIFPPSDTPFALSELALVTTPMRATHWRGSNLMQSAPLPPPARRRVA